MQTYNARDLLELSDEQLWALPEDRHLIQFADGVVESDTRKTIMSTYMWYPLRSFPDVPIRKSFCITADKRFNGGVMLNLINTAVWSADDFYHGQLDKEVLAEIIFETINRIYNHMTVRLAAHVATFSMFDILPLMDDEGIVKAIVEAEPFKSSIMEAHTKIAKRLYDDRVLIGNPIAEAARSGTISMGQLQQCFIRGEMTDIDSSIFPYAIMEGYFRGITGLYEAMIESRSGAKSHIFNTELLKETEYFNRLIQLICQYVQRMHPGDCGGKPIDWIIVEDLIHTMAGKYYYDDQDQLVEITGKEKWPAGTVIRMRSVLACIHPDPEGICETCYGKIAAGIPKGTNVGQVTGVVVGDKITSSVLQTKHLDSTNSVDKYKLTAVEAKYLKYGPKPETLHLKSSLLGKRVVLTVFDTEIANLSDIMVVHDVTNLNAERISSLTRVLITVDDGKGNIEQDELCVSLFNRKASLSHEALAHIQTHKWEKLTERAGNTVIDLTGFDFDKPLFTLPLTHVNMFENMTHIKAFLFSSSSGNPKRLGARRKAGEKEVRTNKLTDFSDPVEALQVTTMKLNSKLNINIVHAEVLMYTLMVRSAADNDYRLPIPGTSGHFHSYVEILRNRSLSGFMAYQNQITAYLSPLSFTNRKRNDHPYDLLLMGGSLE